MFQRRFYYDGLREDRTLSGFIPALSARGAGCRLLKITWKNAALSYTIDLAIGGRPWCYGTAVLAGDRTVTVEDSKGNLLKETSFKVK
ncbi:MAG: hypothetical protein ABSH28_15070 [Acidobacteriota bacterium]|jgi:hypothetical protein